MRQGAAVLRPHNGRGALILLGDQGGADGFQLFLLGFVHLREGKMEFVERLDNRGSHDQPSQPLVIWILQSLEEAVVLLFL